MHCLIQKACYGRHVGVHKIALIRVFFVKLFNQFSTIIKYYNGKGQRDTICLFYIGSLHFLATKIICIVWDRMTVHFI